MGMSGGDCTLARAVRTLLLALRALQGPAGFTNAASVAVPETEQIVVSSSNLLAATNSSARYSEGLQERP
jgi:hypothetical protein